MTNINWPAVRTVLESIAQAAQQEIKKVSAEAGDRVISSGGSGDITSLADEAAETIVKKLLREQLSDYRVALIDESTARLVKLYDGDADPELVIIADALDGTRLNMLQIEAYSTCIVAFAYNAKATLKEIQVAVITTATGETFSAVKDSGIYQNGQPLTAQPKVQSEDTASTNLGIYFDFGGAEPVLAFQYLAPLMGKYLNPGFVVMNSTGFAVTRLLLPTSRMTAIIDVAARLRDRWPELEPIFQHVSGEVNGSHIWDTAAPHLLLKEAGMYVAGSDGSTLDNAPLIVQPPLTGYHMVAAVNETIGRHIVERLNEQEQLLFSNRQGIIDQLQRLYHLAE